jgi:hypothetical protein
MRGCGHSMSAANNFTTALSDRAAGRLGPDAVTSTSLVASGRDFLSKSGLITGFWRDWGTALTRLKRCGRSASRLARRNERVFRRRRFALPFRWVF